MTLAAAAARVLAGDDPHHAVRDFLDAYGRLDVAGRADAVRERPAPTGDTRWDAYLGALAEHLADGPPPAWALDDDRFLDRFWFVSPTPGFRAISLAQAPMSFKRRGVMVPARSLQRV